MGLKEGDIVTIKKEHIQEVLYDNGNRHDYKQLENIGFIIRSVDFTGTIVINNGFIWLYTHDYQIEKRGSSFVDSVEEKAYKQFKKENYD